MYEYKLCGPRMLSLDLHAIHEPGRRDGATHAGRLATGLDREDRKTSRETRSSSPTLRNSTPTLFSFTHFTVARRTSTGGSSHGRFSMSVSFCPRWKR